jgi:hypothetical protein
MFPNLTGTPLAAFALIWNGWSGPPVNTGPDVDVNNAPLGLVVLKKSPEIGFGEATLLGTASQLISRRPDLNDCPLFGFSGPRSARN